MELWLDTSDLSLIKKAKEVGCLYGITTNPSILALSDKPALRLLEELLEIHEGPITAQVTATTADAMLMQGKKLYQLSENLLIKVPVSLEGFKAIYALSQEGIPVMATVIYDFLQAVTAFKAGAIYGALYVGRMIDAGLKPIETLVLIQNFIEMHHLSCKLLAASIRSKQQLLQCIQTGCSAITVKEEVFSFFLKEHPLTTHNSSEFTKALPSDWLIQ